MKIDGCFRLNDKNIPQIESFSVFKGTNKIIKEKLFILTITISIFVF